MSAAKLPQSGFDLRAVKFGEWNRDDSLGSHAVRRPAKIQTAGKAAILRQRLAKRKAAIRRDENAPNSSFTAQFRVAPETPSASPSSGHFLRLFSPLYQLDDTRRQ
jgi:hypothetical protein